VQLYLDSNAIIFAHEGPPGLQQTVIERVVRACTMPGGVVMTSLLARMECRVRPVRERNQRLLAHYDFIFGPLGLHLIPITADVIEQATELRALHSFRTPDSIHLATALLAQADVFLTGDKGLSRCPGLNVEVI
jgi:predicted nucleic acid-binding protein